MDKIIYEIKITLAESEPPIWRRILLDAKTTLADLHYIIQDAMGWTSSHLHEFISGGEWQLGFVNGGTHYEDKEFADDYGMSKPAEDESKIEIEQLLKTQGDSLAYIYDFGDYWSHKIELENIHTDATALKSTTLPICTGGERACPPEDCSGIRGYNDLLETLSDPDDEDYESMRTWANSITGSAFDPDVFDLKETNKALKNSNAKSMAETLMDYDE